MKFIATLTLALLAFSSVAESNRPNVLFIIVDDLGQRDLAVYGSEFYESPNIDQLAQQGMRFNRAYSSHPRCVPARVAFQSGLYPARLGVPGDRDEKLALPADTVTYAERLQQAGYATGYIGKWHLGSKKHGGSPQFQGYDETHIAGKWGAPPSYFYPFDKGNTQGHAHKGFAAVDGAPGDYLTDTLGDTAVDFIQRHKQQPFMLTLAFYSVHTPIEGKPEETAHFTRKLKQAGQPIGGTKQDVDFVDDGTGTVKTAQNSPGYAAMIKSVDDNVGQVMAALKAAGIEQNTLVILTSDHGGLSSRGLNSSRVLATSNAPLRHGKGWLYEGGIRVPLIVRWPEKVAAATVVERPVTGVDHFPTMLEAASLNAQSDIDGESYLGTLLGKPDATRRTAMFWHSPLSRPYSTGDTNASAVTDGDWKLIRWHEFDHYELFNLQLDPDERNNLVDTQPDQLNRMKRILQQWMDATGAVLLDPKKDKKRARHDLDMQMLKARATASE